jgi:predicted RNase H-like HicB family nuclease
MRQFTVIIERDPESGWLVGVVAELPGYHTQAPDMIALELNVREAVEAYFDLAPGSLNRTSVTWA